MPIYEYICRTCGQRFEYLQPISHPPLETCPPDVCQQPAKGGGRVERLISRNVGFIFQGSGFYITDYARKNTRSETAPAESSSESSSGAASSND